MGVALDTKLTEDSFEKFYNKELDIDEGNTPQTNSNPRRLTIFP
jgi:hypothetical protein